MLFANQMSHASRLVSPVVITSNNEVSAILKCEGQTQAPLFTFGKLLLLAGWAALVLCGILILVPEENKTLLQIVTPEPFLLVSAIVFAATPILLPRNQYSQARQFATLLTLNLFALCVLVASWHIINQRDLEYSVLDYLICLGFLVGLVWLWKVERDRPTLRHFLELAIPGGFAACALTGWLFPWLKYSALSNATVAFGTLFFGHLLWFLYILGWKTITRTPSPSTSDKYEKNSDG